MKNLCKKEIADIYDLNIKLRLIIHYSIRTYKLRWYTSTFLISNKMAVVNQYHAPVTLFPLKYPPLPSGKEAGRISHPVWPSSKENSPCSCREK
jgi:hypothetical protein